MKLKLIIFLTLGLITTCLAQQPETKYIQKSFPKLGISISLPENWFYAEKEKNELFTCVFKEDDQKHDFNTVGLTLSYEALNSTAPADSVFNQVKNIIKYQSDNQQVTEYPGDKIQGRPTKIYTYVFTFNQFKITRICTYFIENNMLFCLQAHVMSERLEHYEPVFKAIRNSIQLEKVEPTILIDGYEYKKIESRYRNASYGFSMDFPLGWYYIEGVSGNAVMVKKANQDPSEFLSMGVNIQEGYDPKITAEQYHNAILQVMKDQLIAMGKDEKIQTTKFTHPLYATYKSHFIAYVNNKKVIVFLYTIIKNTKGYLFITTSDEAHLADNEKIFDNVFKSMMIKQ